MKIRAGFFYGPGPPHVPTLRMCADVDDGCASEQSASPVTNGHTCRRLPTVAACRRFFVGSTTTSADRRQRVFDAGTVLVVGSSSCCAAPSSDIKRLRRQQATNATVFSWFRGPDSRGHADAIRCKLSLENKIRDHFSGADGPEPNNPSKSPVKGDTRRNIAANCRRRGGIHARSAVASHSRIKRCGDVRVTESVCRAVRAAGGQDDKLWSLVRSDQSLEPHPSQRSYLTFFAAFLAAALAAGLIVRSMLSTVIDPPGSFPLVRSRSTRTSV